MYPTSAPLRTPHNICSVQKQRGGVDCGCFAVAFAVSAAFGENPACYVYEQTKMRDHLALCFEQGFFVPFPSTLRKTRSSDCVELTFVN